MKGIILAGGAGTRLWPATAVVCKQLLPVYDKPMICYPLATLMLLGVRKILIISTPSDTPLIEGYLGDGAHLGLSLSYAVQTAPRGIAEAFVIGRDFVGSERVCLVLGDNVFYVGGQLTEVRARLAAEEGALIFGYHVRDVERFGVIEFADDDPDRVVSLEEKPARPRSSYAAVGLYAYPPDVADMAASIKPSARGELEITCLNAAYLREGRLRAVRLRRGTTWLDAGTPEALLEAAQFVGSVERRQGLKIACVEEVAYRMGFINEAGFRALMAGMRAGSPYQSYLEGVLDE
jgi:glucose-1-phosphate thymidylyltransferase